MRASKQQAREAIWSTRSQKSWLKQRELERARERCRKQIAFCERRIAEGKKTSETQAATAAGGSFAIQQALSRTLADVADRERELGAYRLREKSLQAEIDALTPTAKQAAERAKHQAALAALILARNAKDATIDSVLERLRKVLEARAALSAKILAVAPLIEFASNVDLDAERFAALEASLPGDVFAHSREWVSRFFGMESEKEPYTIGDNDAVLPETLADSGVYRAGENVLLSKERAKLLPPEEGSFPVPGPVEMETTAGNCFGAVVIQQEEPDSFPVSGFISR